MAKLTREQIEEIIKDQMPGYRVVEHGPVQDAVAQRVQADQATPDLDELKRSVEDAPAAGNPGNAEDAMGGGPAAAEPAAAEPAAVANGEDEGEGEDQMVVLAPENPASPLDHGAKAKVVVVSARDGKIVTSQG